ncbi:iron-containing redox enzyme family protein [Puia sp.]|uniref:iron-containing redox enzyme family protein n=1 Tax=Puia sp. TaxID=2045100 RepID=UPI002F41FD6D
METVELMPAATFLQEMKTKLDHDPVSHHILFTKMAGRRLSGTQLKRFAVQWYKTARDHKLAFPAIILNTPVDDVRFELIEILDDEYGHGDREKIHAKLLYRFVKVFFDSDEEVERVPKLPAVTNFGREVMDIWKNGHPVYAFGLHFSLEYLAKDLHATYSDALAKYEFLSEFHREYFLYHKVAEQQHADYSEYGFLYYSKLSGENQRLLEEGIEKGIQLLMDLWNDFDAHIFEEPAVI